MFLNCKTKKELYRSSLNKFYSLWELPHSFKYGWKMAIKIKKADKYFIYCIYKDTVLSKKCVDCQKKVQIIPKIFNFHRSYDQHSRNTQ